MRAECYNPIFPRDPRFRMPSRNQPGFFLASLAVLVALALTSRAAAQQWDAPARELAEKIMAHAQSRSSLSLTVKNLSSLPPARMAEVQHAIESELRRRGVGLVEADRAIDQARVTLSENTTGYLWIAEIGHDDSWEVVMVPVPAPASAERAPAALTLRRTTLWSQPEPMLDVASAADGGLLVLGSDTLSLYRVQDRKWQVAGVAPLAHPRPWPRDLRGRLVLETSGSLRAYLPGVQCAGSIQPQLSVTCQASDDPWPLSPEVYAFFSGSRNFFTGAVKLARGGQAGDLGPFYSAAMFPQGERGFWIVAFTDGNAKLINAQGQVGTAFTSWGSDVAGVASDCGSGWQVLATRATDRTLPDALTAYEIVNREAVEAAPALEFAGPVTALWSVADGRSATAISHNLRTGDYEAFSVSAVCSR
jgi:hypothetical protein